VLLARLERPDVEKPDWAADHSVRRFVRPVLMRDPQVEIERKRREDAEKKEEDTQVTAYAAPTAAAPETRSRRRGR
jgi:hypothetical protein